MSESLGKYMTIEEIEERLHERLRDGMADAGMYPDCAEHVGMIDHGDEEQARWQAAYDEWWAEQNSPQTAVPTAPTPAEPSE